MRKMGVLRRYILIVGSTGILYTCAASSCVPVLLSVLGDEVITNLLRATTNGISQQPDTTNDEPSAAGSFLNALLDDIGFEDDNNKDEDLDDWWDDLWK